MHTVHWVSTRKQPYAGCKAFLLMLQAGQQPQGLPLCPAASAFSSRLCYGRVLPALVEAPPSMLLLLFSQSPRRTAAQELFRAWILPRRWKGRKSGTGCRVISGESVEGEQLKERDLPVEGQHHAVRMKGLQACRSWSLLLRT